MNYERWWEKGWFWSGIFAGGVFAAMAVLAGYIFDLPAAARFWAAAIAFPVGASLEWLNIGARQIGVAVGAVGVIGAVWFFMGGAGVMLPGAEGPGIRGSVDGGTGSGGVGSSAVRSSPTGSGGSGGGSPRVNTDAAPSGGSSDGSTSGSSGRTSGGSVSAPASDGGAANTGSAGGGAGAATSPASSSTTDGSAGMEGVETEAEEPLGPLAEHFLEVRNPAEYPVELTYGVDGEQRRLGELGAGSTRLFRVVGRSGGYIRFVAESASGRSTTRVRLTDDVATVTLR